MYQEIIDLIKDADKVLIGIGPELKVNEMDENSDFAKVKEALFSVEGKEYEILKKMVADKDYFIISSNVDGALVSLGFDQDRWVTPMGNPFCFQCMEADCDGFLDFSQNQDELRKLDTVLCPNCKKKMKVNIRSKEHPETYKEQGYLPQWERYQKWLSCTLNRKLVILELGEGFGCPSLFRWPFEKTVFFHQKAKMIRVNGTLWQIGEEIKDRAMSVPVNAKEFLSECEKHICEKE